MGDAGRRVGEHADAAAHGFRCCDRASTIPIDDAVYADQRQDRSRKYSAVVRGGRGLEGCAWPVDNVWTSRMRQHAATARAYAASDGSRTAIGGRPSLQPGEPRESAPAGDGLVRHPRVGTDQAGDACTAKDAVGSGERSKTRGSVANGARRTTGRTP